VDFITTVLLCAPDRFVRREWLKEDEQLNLERAFRILDEKFPLVEERVADRTALMELRELMEASHQAYVAGDCVNGARLIQEFERLVRTQTKPRLVGKPNEH
jgi:hypothetical protein